MKRIRILVYIVLAGGLGAGVLFYSYTGQDHAKKIFEDATLSSGISYTGMTFGGAWGDFDGDSLPDLFLTNHLNSGMLYRNTGNGQFENVTEKYFTHKDLSGDKHGTLWSDFDNDGDQDLLILRGGGRGVGAESNAFFINTGNAFEEKSQEKGISNAPARARMPLAYDFDRDGLLDVFLGALKRKDGLAPPAIFIQKKEKFLKSENLVNFATPNVPFCINTEINQDMFQDFVFRAEAHNRTVQVLSMSTLPFTELKIMPNTHYDDIAAGDFNGDLMFDLYLARQLPERYDVLLEHRGSNQAFAVIKLNTSNVDKKMGFSFESKGDLKIDIWPTYPEKIISPNQVYIGSKAINPANLSFELSEETEGIQGDWVYQPGKQTGLFISRDFSGKWQILFSTDKTIIEKDREKHSQVALRISSLFPITDLMPIGEVQPPKPPPDRLFINYSDRLEEKGNQWKINEPLSGSENVVSGDFDNDMDLDLYIVASGNITNKGNFLLLNHDNKRFITLPNAGGALGGKLGVGDAVITADYDMDGFLDLLVANGKSMGYSFDVLGLPAQDTGYKLYHNTGNENHWIEIDLEGRVSNRDGIGAKVYLSAGGVTQVRMQDGGVHNRGQNHQRIHFGLGKNTSIEKITIHWPSGKIQEMKGIKSDQLIRIEEPLL